MSERTAWEHCATTKKQVLSVPELTDFVERYSRKLGKQNCFPDEPEEAHTSHSVFPG